MKRSVTQTDRTRHVQYILISNIIKYKYIVQRNRFTFVTNKKTQPHKTARTVPPNATINVCFSAPAPALAPAPAAADGARTVKITKLRSQPQPTPIIDDAATDF